MSDTDAQKPDDRSKFIRTYAKDVAVLTNTPVAPPPATKFAPAKKEKGKEKSKKVPPTPPAAPPRPPTPTETPAWEAVRPAAPLPAFSYNTHEEDQERGAILDRLRARTITVTPQPPAPLPSPLPPVSLPPLPSAFAPLPTQIPPVGKPDNLHTYKSDFADHVDERGASAFTVLAADADTKKKTRIEAKKSMVPVILGGLALLVLGGGGIAGAFWYLGNTGNAPSAPLSIPSLVFADEKVKLSGTGPELLEALARTADQALVEGNVLITYLSESTTTPKGQVREIPLEGGDLIRALALPAPEILLRNIAEESTVGVISAGLEVRPFFIFRVTSYERTFAGMLAWEATMARDLEILYPARETPDVNPEATALNLSTSTPVMEPPRPMATFTDSVVSSHDVRVLRDTYGATLMLYGYRDKETLILARDEAAFTALLQRLSAGSR